MFFIKRSPSLKCNKLQVLQNLDWAPTPTMCWTPFLVLGMEQ